MKLINRENGQVLADDVKPAKTFFKRLKGLLFTDQLALGCGLHIQPCRSVHTFFMKYSIDVVHLDDEHKIVFLEEKLQPGKLGQACRLTASIVELPAGTIEKTHTRVGDVIQLEK
jgi:uncharacterized membrane protein (UPF0127 family)